MIRRQFVIATMLLFAVAILMAVYLWQLRRHETLAPRPVGAPQHVTPPPSGPTEKATIFIAYDDPGELHARTIPIPLASGRQQRAETLLRELLAIYQAKGSSHPLAPGAEIRNVFLIDPGAAVIDVNAAFVSGQTSGILAEELTIASMIQTLAANVQGLNRVKILVDGKDRDTLAGHADLSGFYAVAQVAELARQLAPQ